MTTKSNVVQCKYCKGFFIGEKLRDSHEVDCKWACSGKKIPRPPPTKLLSASRSIFQWLRGK